MTVAELIERLKLQPNGDIEVVFQTPTDVVEGSLYDIDDIDLDHDNDDKLIVILS